VVTLSVHSGVSPDGKRGLIRVRAQTKPEQSPLYMFDVVMTALVEVQEGHENMPMTQYVRTSGPAMVYAFVRQMVADLTWRGRFGPLWLSPVNLVAMTDQPPREVREDTVLYGPTARALKRIRSKRKHERSGNKWEG
jgi:preprotein translocase subunit SecB